MRMKPKSTVHNPRALLYKRFTDFENSLSADTIYRTVIDGKLWRFVAGETPLVPFEGATATNTVNIIASRMIKFGNRVFRYTYDSDIQDYVWDEIDIGDVGAGIVLLSATISNIAKYQTNKYYLVGSFDYIIRGTISSSDTQPIKGNIMHLRSFEIKYFDDSIHIDHDDLVVIDGHLYGVEELAYDIKRSPKPYTVYFATLNNIK